MEFKVSSKSNPNSVAGAIIGASNENKEIILVCVGAGAVNQAIKAVAISRGYAAPSGIDFSISPSFKTIYINDDEVSAVSLKINKEER
jgi:stage V sporulation protein S